MGNFLFDEFNNISPTAWKQKIQVELLGEDYNDSLVWKSNEGISVKPFYTLENRHNKKIRLPGQGFKICQSIYVDDESIANKLALDSLNRGATAIQFIAKEIFDYTLLLNKIDLKNTFIYFNFAFLNAKFNIQLENYCQGNSIFFQVDIIGNLAKTGNWFINIHKDILETTKFIKTINNPVCVDASLYQNAGATIIQQLSYALAQTNEYIEIFGESVASKIHYSFSVGGNYFFEIAKLRAFRILLTNLYSIRGIQNSTVHIFTKPSYRNKTIYDYNVNMLRTTSECMSAILGGSNTIANISYDSIYHKSNEFGERIARNQLLILQKETRLSQAQEFANGSYYIENIEKQFAKKALDLFKQIEKSGGFLKQLKNGVIQKKINENAQKEQKEFDQNQKILLGINKLPNINDRMKKELQIYPFLKTKNLKTLILPVLQKRLSEEYEKKRLKKES